MLKLLVLGATGGAGRHIVSEALDRGHLVTAFVRSPEKLQRTSENLVVIKGNPLDTESLIAASAGQDVLLSALSAGTLGPATLMQQFAWSFTEAASRAKVDRLITLSTAFSFPNASLLVWVLGNTLFRNVLNDHIDMEAVVVASPLNWTIIRPPRLVDGPKTGTYRIKESHLPSGGMSISRSDLADFVVNLAESGKYSRKVVGVCH